MKSFCEMMTGATELWNKRPLNALHAQRAEGSESGAGAPAVRPQHVEAEREREEKKSSANRRQEEQCQPQAKEEQGQPQAKKRQFSSSLMSSECTRTKRSASSPSTKGRGEKSVTWLRERNKVIEEKSIRQRDRGGLDQKGRGEVDQVRRSRRSRLREGRAAYSFRKKQTFRKSTFELLENRVKDEHLIKSGDNALEVTSGNSGHGWRTRSVKH